MANRYILILFQFEKDIIDWQLFCSINKQLEKIKSSKKETEIDVWLESSGGSGDSAYKIALALRSKADKIRVVIPDYAKSAATLFSLCANEIYMAPTAELGPLDAQLKHPLDQDIIVSALDIAKSIDHLARIALSVVYFGGARLIDFTGLRRQDIVDAMLDFSAKFIEPISGKIDPHLVHGAWRELELAKSYASRLMNISSVVKPPKTKEKIEKIARNLAESYPTHSCVIDLQEAESMGLNVKPIKDYDKHLLALAKYREAETKLISILQLLEFSEIERLENELILDKLGGKKDEKKSSKKSLQEVSE